MVDDDLSWEEMGAICGLYKSYTGHGNQSHYKSWWPQDKEWVASGLHVGYWTVQCETWFHSHREKIRQGKAQPKTSSEWKSNLKRFLYKTKKVQNNFRSKAEDVIGGLAFRR
ncbi:hypothetical protein C8Q75DRAFT_727306 [Abortiporus biennis]|nr:hypothetical protein C8Q75DRAFT_727306 [Abortiporus biennis]